MFRRLQSSRENDPRPRNARAALLAQSNSILGTAVAEQTGAETKAGKVTGGDKSCRLCGHVTGFRSYNRLYSVCYLHFVFDVRLILSTSANEVM